MLHHYSDHRTDMMVLKMDVKNCQEVIVKKRSPN